VTDRIRGLRRRRKKKRKKEKQLIREAFRRTKKCKLLSGGIEPPTSD